MEPPNSSSGIVADAHPLNPGTAWSIFLSRGSTSSEQELLRYCFIKQSDETAGSLLYRLRHIPFCF